jgi:hypothetical protein
MPTAPAVGRKISLRLLGLSTPPHMKCYIQAAYVWGQQPTTKPNTLQSLASWPTQRHHIRHLSVFLDSQLVVLQLNNVYRVRDPCLFRKYLQVRLLSRHFDSITFTHIPRQLNQTTDQIANMVLDWHISHQATHT